MKISPNRVYITCLYIYTHVCIYVWGILNMGLNQNLSKTRTAPTEVLKFQKLVLILNPMLQDWVPGCPPTQKKNNANASKPIYRTQAHSCFASVCIHRFSFFHTIIYLYTLSFYRNVGANLFLCI